MPLSALSYGVHCIFLKRFDKIKNTNISIVFNINFWLLLTLLRFSTQHNVVSGLKKWEASICATKYVDERLQEIRDQLKVLMRKLKLKLEFSS